MSSSIIEVIDRYPSIIEKTISLTFDNTSQNGTKYKKGLPDPILKKYTPLVRYVNAKLAFRKIEDSKPTLAFIVGVDGEYPIKREPVQFGIEMVGSTKIARARLLTESDFDLLRDAELHLRANEQAVYDAFVRQYLQIPAYLTQTVVCLCTVLVLQLYTAGQSTYIDPETHLGFEISYVDQVPIENRPLALVGTALWTDVVNSRPLENLKDHLNNYYKKVFRLPEDIGMPALVADAMLNANDTKVKIARLKGVYEVAPEVIPSLPRPTIEDCMSWLRNELTSAAQTIDRMPGVLVTDAFYYTEDDNGLEIQKPYLSSDSYVFLNEGMVEGAYVPTATNDYASTFAVVTEVISKAPKREKVSIDTRFLAACFDPRYLGWRKVI